MKPSALCRNPVMWLLVVGLSLLTGCTGKTVPGETVVLLNQGKASQEPPPPVSVCGDTICALDEDCKLCAQDCGVCGAPIACGDAVCAVTESCDSCGKDCGQCPPPPSVCGDTVCQPEENCTLCSADCGVCGTPVVCGDAVCAVTESCESCGKDCGQCPPPPSVAPPLNTCRVDVGRTPETVHPNEGMQKRVMAENERYRALPGFHSWDVFVGEDGGRAVIDCTLPAGNVAKATSQGLILPVYQLKGMPPLNYFLVQQRPGVDKAIGRDGQALQLLPFQLPVAVSKAAQDFNAVVATLPKPNFDFAPLLSALPGASVAVSSNGTWQINNVVRFEITPVAAEPATGKSTETGAPASIDMALASASSSAVRFRQTVVVGPDGCAWSGDECPDEIRVPNIQDRTKFHGKDLEPGEVMDVLYNEVKRLVDDLVDAGKPVVAAEVLAEALEAVDFDTADWLEIQYHIVSGVGDTAVDGASSANFAELSSKAALSAQLADTDPQSNLGVVRQAFTVTVLTLPSSYLVGGGGMGCTLLR